VLLGYPVTRRSGIAFAMVTLGLGELVAACFLMFPGFFGGEAGVTLQRTRVPSMLGLDYGRGAGAAAADRGLDAAVLGACTGCHARLSAWPRWRCARTPSASNTWAFAPPPCAGCRWPVASTLAGVAGALSALAYEIVTVDAVSLHLSANVLLMTVIGGLGSLWGPLVGAPVPHRDAERGVGLDARLALLLRLRLRGAGVAGARRHHRAVAGRAPAAAAAAHVALALVFALLLVVFIETAYQVALGEPTRLPGWRHLGPGALQACCGPRAWRWRRCWRAGCAAATPWQPA
jgi:branched-chain amino acid transport system permease protein